MSILFERVCLPTRYMCKLWTFLKKIKKDYLAECLAKVEQTPDDPTLISQLGWAYYTNGKEKQALDYLGKALILNRDIPDLYPYAVLSDIYYFSDNYAKACEVLASGIVEKLDKFRGKEEINGLEAFDKGLREKYLEYRMWSFNRFQTSAGAAARQGATNAARKAGFSSYEESVRYEIDNAGIYDLAKKLSKKGSIPSKNRRMMKLFIWGVIIITLLILFLGSKLVVAFILGVVLSAIAVGLYGYRDEFQKFTKKKTG